MRKLPVYATALGTVLLAAPVLFQAGGLTVGDPRQTGWITLAQGGAGADSQGTGG